MTAFKMMVYLKRLKEGLPPRAAAWAAKRAGDELSVLLRKEMIQKVETALPGLPSEIQLEIIPILDKAKERLLSKERGSF